MSTEENKALARRAVEETMNQRNWAVFDELHAPDYVCHLTWRTIQGREPFKQVLSMLLTALPDLHLTIEDLFGGGRRQGRGSLYVSWYPSRRLHGYSTDRQTGNSDRDCHYAYRKRENPRRMDQQ